MKQLGYVGLSLVYLDYMTFHDVFGSRSSYGAREKREDGQGGFEHCELLLRLLKEEKNEIHVRDTEVSVYTGNRK